MLLLLLQLLKSFLTFCEVQCHNTESLPKYTYISSCHVFWNDRISRVNFLHVVRQSFCDTGMVALIPAGKLSVNSVSWQSFSKEMTASFCMQKPDCLFMVGQQNFCSKYRQDSPYHKGVFHLHRQLKETSSVIKGRAGSCLYLLE
jgi:hypothetical protein